MSSDNATKFESWNIPEADNRHQWDAESRQQMQKHFGDYQVLHSLNSLSQEVDREIFREIMRNNPNDPAAAIKALQAINRKKSDQLLTRAGLKQQPKRKGWNSSEINSQVRNLLNQK